jgi:hypothetical protein
VEWEDIFRKRRIKKNVKAERKEPEPSIASPLPASLVTVEMKDEHPCLYFPVTKEEVREVLAALPTGTLDGLTAVILEAGTTYMNTLPEDALPQDDDEDKIVLDPYLGRRSFEISPGIYIPIVKGIYTRQDNVIRLFGLAAQPPIELEPGELKMMRFGMMKTLLHEVAHHYDWSRRVGRGRWMMDEEEKYEQYAENMTRKWGEDVLASYIEDLVTEVLKGFED